MAYDTDNFVANAPGKFFEMPTEAKMEACPEQAFMEYEVQTPGKIIMEDTNKGVAQMKRQKSTKRY